MKRTASPSGSDSDSSSDDDFGPSLSQAQQQKEEVFTPPVAKRVKKKKKKLKFEQVYLDNLPEATRYERSYMHRESVTHIVVARQTDFVITASSDGHVKFWKKMADDVEFVKHYQAHLGKIHSLEVSPDGLRVVSTAEDRMIKFFDVQSYDMINMIAVPFVPSASCWLRHASDMGTHVGVGLYTRVAVADCNGSLIRVYKMDQTSSTCLSQISLHSFPVRCMALNQPKGVIVSIDAKGMVEYWRSDTLEVPSEVSFKYKTDTDLYSLAKERAEPTSISFSPVGDVFAVTSADKKIRIFNYLTGKLKRVYDESAKTYAQNPATLTSLSEHDIGRKQAVEKDIEATPEALQRINAVFDETGNYLVYSSMLGVKILNIEANQVVRTLGTAESAERFLTVALYQGTPKVDTQMLLARAASKKGGSKSKTTEEILSSQVPDPTIYCSSFNRRRFYCLSRRLPDESEESRDVLNEKPTEDEQISVQANSGRPGLGREAVIHTTMGDINLKLFTDDTPKTVENFCTHARNGYYDNIKFHRVIKGFMIQTGDPLGDGTGGESIWGGDFEDEFVRTLRHDRPFTLSMANSGPNTNGSQFFITTAPTPWLDNKHTVFGRVTRGFEVCSSIENLKVDKYDRPLEEVKMLGIEVVQ